MHKRSACISTPTACSARVLGIVFRGLYAGGEMKKGEKGGGPQFLMFRHIPKSHFPSVKWTGTTVWHIREHIRGTFGHIRAHSEHIQCFRSHASMPRCVKTHSFQQWPPTQVAHSTQPTFLFIKLKWCRGGGALCAAHISL